MKHIIHLNFLVLGLLVLTAFMAVCAVSNAQEQSVTSEVAISQADIKKAESYLQNLKTVRADFIQTAYNGSRLTGVFYLDRPGKLRFEYNEIADFIVADGVFIYFYDAELKEQTNAPIGQTLADFLLRDNLSLDDDLRVTNVETEDGLQAMTLREKDDEGAGSVKLFFTDKPYTLKKWQVTDAAGLTTEIFLRNMERDIDLPAKLFAFFTPKGDKPAYNQ